MTTFDFDRRNVLPSPRANLVAWTVFIVAAIVVAAALLVLFLLVTRGTPIL